MKNKLLFFVLLFCIGKMQTVTAQDPVDSKPQKNENIPFGKKQPPPDLTTHQNRFLQQMTNDVNAFFTPGKPLFNASQSKKSPAYYRQLFLERKRNQDSFMKEYRAAVTKGGNGNAASSDFQLTKDINALAESNPRNFTNHRFDLFDSQRNDSAAYAVLNNIVYFVADDGIHGSELWRSDGTGSGTYLLKDIEPGDASSLVFNLTAVQGKIYFTGYSSVYGYGAWVSDGTETGTQLLAGASQPTHFFEMGDKVYFIADGSSFWTAIWQTDGTPAGTNQVIDLWDPFFGEQITQPTIANGLLYFTFIDYETLSWQIWRSDLTVAGTFHVGPNYPLLDLDYNFLNYTPAQLTNYNNKIYFSANDGTGRKLWVSDGTDAGTTLAPGNNDVLISADYMCTSFPVLNNVLYVPAGETGGNALYQYDASNTAGLVKVKDLAAPGITAFITPEEMLVVNQSLYFKVTSYSGGLHDELWRSAGTDATTNPVRVLLPGESLQELYNGDGTLYFVKKGDGVYGTELWKSNGTNAGTALVSDVFKGTPGSFPACLTIMNGKLFFEAANGVYGNELFMTDGTDKSTALVKDINTVTTPSSYAGFNFYNFYGYRGMVAIGKDVLFTATERVYGSELYHSNGTSGGTALLNDIIPGEAGFTLKQFESKNDVAYFVAESGSTNAIYKSDGKKNGLQKVTPDYSNIQGFAVADNGTVFYATYNYNAGAWELWRSNGTDAGNILLSSALSVSNYLNIIGNTAIFIAGDALHGYELWSSDGSVAGTQIVKDLNPGVADMLPGGGMFLYKNELYFAASDGSTPDPSFWKTNGTEAGTVKLKNIDPWWSSNVSRSGSYYGISNGILYFSAVDHSNSDGTVFYKTDGTPAGTQLVKDINPLSSTSTTGPYLLTDVDGTLFFTADDGVHGRELWKSDGTADGTQMVSDINPGAFGSSFSNLTSFAGKLFFSYAENGILYLWSSDGMAEGTLHVADPGITNVRVGSLLANGDKLFMYTYSTTIGGEMYVGTVKNNVEKFAAIILADKEIAPEKFNVLLHPNPVTSKATLEIGGSAKSISLSILDMQGKTVWQSNNVSAGRISLPTERFPAGVYMVTVKSGVETRTIKFIKE